MASALDYVVFGHDDEGSGKQQHKLLVFHGTLPSHDAAYYLQQVELEPMIDQQGQACPALALVEHDLGRRLLAIIQPAKNRPHGITSHYILLPAEVLAEAAIQYQGWLAFLPAAFHDIDATLPLLAPPDFAALEMETRLEHLGAVLDELPDDGFEHLLSLLGAVMDEGLLRICHFPADFKRRLALVSGIQSLLPGKLAARMTFASQAPLNSESVPQLIFVDDEDAQEADDSWVYDWRAPEILPEVLGHAYIDVLRELWRGDLAGLLAGIESLAALVDTTSEQGDLAETFERLAGRFRLDQQVQTDADIATDVMIEVLDGSCPPAAELRFRYIEKLLANALQNRDAVAGRWVAAELERDSELETALAGIFQEIVEDQPDAVYVFIRNRLMQQGLDEKWITRLQDAGRKSLQVAIEDGDVGILADWLELIAHEPQSYQLQEILRDGVLAATERAYDDGALGIRLMLIAARRVPELVDVLSADQRLMAALESQLQEAALESLIEERAEYFLLALYHGVKVAEGQPVTAAVAKRLLALQKSTEAIPLPANYHPGALIQLLATQASHQATEEALDLLLQHIISAEERPVIAEVMEQLANRNLLFPRLSHVLERDDLPLDKVQSIMNLVSGIKSAAPRDVIDAYFILLDYYQWEPQLQRMMEALTRMMAQHHEVQVSYRHLWKLFDCCHALQIEGAARVVIMQLLQQYGEEEDAALVVDGIAKICQQIGWSKSLKTTVNNWWREYTHSCNLAQLQRLERELDAQRHLDPQKQILKTMLAMRRWLHSRDAGEFAEAVNTAFSIVEHITEAFDVAHLSEIDSHTIRREVDAVSGELSSEQRHILANNLRNLAVKITQMAEKRSKPSLIRSDDSIEHQLTHGEANPHGSIDMMKWIAGYLDGLHHSEEE